VAREKMKFADLTKDKNVAVVGNAQSLFSKNYGEFIDKHDIVIRFNSAAPLYYKDNPDILRTHGHKTDVWAFWTVGAFIRKSLNNEAIRESFYQNDIYKIQVKENNYIAETKKFISDTLPKFDYVVLSNYLKRSAITLNDKTKIDFQPSAGISVLQWLKISKPATVHIFGFDFKKTPTFTDIDKHEQNIINQIDMECKHNFLAEELYANKYIIKQKNFRLYS
jgi:hypothetical protein